MREVGRRIIASIVGFAVLAIGANCQCLAALAPASSQPSAMPCCAHGHSAACRHSSPARQAPCDAACQHCGQLVLNDQIQSADLTPALAQFVGSISTLQPISPILADVPRWFAGSQNDLSPPDCPSTLLSLHCALMI
jgi:hypothetical protein